MADARDCRRGSVDGARVEVGGGLPGPAVDSRAVLQVEDGLAPGCRVEIPLTLMPALAAGRSAGGDRGALAHVPGRVVRVLCGCAARGALAGPA